MLPAHVELNQRWDPHAGVGKNDRGLKKHVLTLYLIFPQAGNDNAKFHAMSFNPNLIF